MSRKLIGILIIFSGVLLLAGIIYILFFNGLTISNFINKFRKEDISQEKIMPEEQDELEQTEPVTFDTKRIIVDEEELNKETETQDTKTKDRYITKNDLKRMAASFAERFGSYSNQSNFSNIVDLKIFMSERMREWADVYVREQRQKDPVSLIYYGITTKAVAQEIKDFDDDISQATILVNTRRREAVSSTSNTSNFFEQDIIINFIQEKGAWKVDRAYWQAR